MSAPGLDEAWRRVSTRPTRRNCELKTASAASSQSVGVVVASQTSGTDPVGWPRGRGETLAEAGGSRPGIGRLLLAVGCNWASVPV
jgi:hypothetical protein